MTYGGSEVVETFDISVTVKINKHAMDTPEEYSYDWTASNGAESAMLFETADDAKYDARGHFGF